MSSINVLVTGIGGGSHGEQILKALRLIDDPDINIIGTDVTDITTGKRIVDTFYRVPLATDEKFKEVLFKIVDKHNVKFIFHGSEPELKFLSENRKLLEERGIGHPLNSQSVIDLCMDKLKTLKTLNELGFPTGKYKKINSVEDTQGIDFFPLVLKPSTGSGGSAHVNICFDKDDLELSATYMLKYGVDTIAQEYIFSDNEFTIGVSSDKNKNVFGCIVIKRILGNSLSTRLKIRKGNRLYMISTGISQGEVIKDQNITEQATRIAKGIQSVGPLNIQCRVLDGRIIPFEINPRLSGTTSIRAIVGYNEPKALLTAHLFNTTPNLSEFETGTVLRTIEEVLV